MSVSPTLTHPYAKAGTYTITLGAYTATAYVGTARQTVVVPSAASVTPRDTLYIIHYDTTVLVRTVHDTVFSGAPIFPAGLEIRDPNGEKAVVFNNQYLGRLSINADGTVSAYKYLGPYLGLPLWQTFPSQNQAIRALLSQ